MKILLPETPMELQSVFPELQRLIATDRPILAVVILLDTERELLAALLRMSSDRRLTDALPSSAKSF